MQREDLLNIVYVQTVKRKQTASRVVRKTPDVPDSIRIANDSETHFTYQFQYRKCNKPTCTHCKNIGHGPYWYAYWRENGKLHSRYIGKGEE